MEKSKITFGKIFWPTLVATAIMTIIGIIFFFLILFGVIGSIAGSGTSMLEIKENTILHMKLNGPIIERSNNEVDPMALSLNSNIGLSDILNGFDEAQKDERIKGIFIEVDNLQCGYATAKAIRNAINKFESSGKFVVAYNSGELITQKEYYLTSAANEIYGFPTSVMEFLGLGTEISFFKEGLNMLDLEFQVIRGSNNDFKSAVEPFYLNSMSDSSKLQINTYLSSMWKDIKDEIAVDRKVDVNVLNRIADSALIQRSEDAVKFKLMDALMYKDQLLEYLKKKVNISADEKLEFVAMEKYCRNTFLDNQLLVRTDNPNIAVITAEGEISKGGDGLNSNKICKYFREVRENDSIKAVVFRINSPGGSALASEEIWREVYLTNLKKKVIVSMGDVAASGGYYIAAPAYRIFAETNTITGSIGVFGLIPYTGKMFENKLGVTFDRASTNKFALMSLNKKLTEEEFEMIQNQIDETYQLFLERVASGRKKTKEVVNTFARGRVWTGSDALKKGLVDELGGMDDALAYAVKTAGVASPKIVHYPLASENQLANILELFEEPEDEVDGSSTSALSMNLMNFIKNLNSIENEGKIQMRLPYLIDIN
jgi:protease-4